MRNNMIKLHVTESDNPNNLYFTMEYSRGVKKYFLNDKMYVQYDVDISDVPKSITIIPAISGLIMLAWHIGADIYVKEIDEEYFQSLESIKQIMKNWYPKLPFSEIYADTIVKNDVPSSGEIGILFSGGIDSMTTYIRHNEHNINLIHCNIREKHFSTNKRHLVDFAYHENVIINFINTNIMDVIHERLLTAEFGFGIIFTSLCAPLTAKKQINTLMIASSLTEDFKYPWGSQPDTDNKIHWSGCRVIHDGFELTRQNKIKLIKNFILNSGDPIILKTLSLVPDNCISLEHANKTDFICGSCKSCLKGSCEKCLRNIVGLTLEGIDANECGYNINNNTFEFIKNSLINKTLFARKLLVQTKGEVITNEADLFFWRDIQMNIPPKINSDVHGSEEFFIWFKNYKFANYKPRINIYELPKLIIATIAFRSYPLYCNIPSRVTNSNLFRKPIEIIYEYIK